jgi:ABC-type multidrug transport system fused ATPase/permease subunit
VSNGGFLITELSIPWYNTKKSSVLFGLLVLIILHMKKITFIIGAMAMSVFVVPHAFAQTATRAEMAREDASARMEQKQLQAEMMQDRMKEIQKMQEQRIGDAEAIQQRMLQSNQMREQKRENAQDVRARVQERMHVERALIMERRTEMANRVHSRMVFGLDISVQKMSALLDRVNARIDAMADQGIDVSDAQSLASDMQNRLASIKNSLADLQSLSGTIEVSGSTPSELNQSLRLSHLEFIEKVKVLRGELISVRESFGTLVSLLQATKE